MNQKQDKMINHEFRNNKTVTGPALIGCRPLAIRKVSDTG